MMDLSELARRCQQNVTDPQARATIDEAVRRMQSGAGRQMAQNITPGTAAQIERAAQAAQSGDKAAAMQAIQQMLNTPDGAALAKQLQFLMGK